MGLHHKHIKKYRGEDVHKATCDDIQNLTNLSPYNLQMQSSKLAFSFIHTWHSSVQLFKGTS